MSQLTTRVRLYAADCNQTEQVVRRSDFWSLPYLISYPRYLVGGHRPDQRRHEGLHRQLYPRRQP